MPIPTISQLPIEIWEHVLDYRADEIKASSYVATRALSVCTVVCRAWRTRASRHLSHYELVPILLLRRRSDVEFAVKTFVTSPALRRQVCRLSIQVTDGDQSWGETVVPWARQVENAHLYVRGNTQHSESIRLVQFLRRLGHQMSQSARVREKR